MTSELEQFRRTIARRIGLAFDDTKLEFLAEVLQRRLDANRMAPTPYLAKLDTDGSRQEHSELAAELTVGETYFFRNREQFRAFVEIALPDRMLARAATRQLRLLSVGTASGEEAYSLVIAMRESHLDPTWQVEVGAVDINPIAIDRARRARYSQWSLRETPDDVKQRWFRADGKDFVLDDAIRNAVTFEQRNVVDDDPALWRDGVYDVVFCRNMLMYLTPDHARHVIERIEGSLVTGGYLFLGHAETLRGLSSNFHLCHTHATFYYQRKQGGSAAPTRETPRGDLPPHAVPIDVDWATSWVDTVRRASERIAALTETGARSATLPRGSDSAAVGRALDLLARERFADALDQLPSSTRDSEALLLRAVLLAHGGKLDAAREVCNALLAADELHAGAHYVLALCCEGMGERRLAIDHDQVAAYLDPTFAMPRLHLGLMARRDGDRQTARRELGHALSLLEREEASRVLLFGGGFPREALVALCRAELGRAGGTP